MQVGDKPVPIKAVPVPACNHCLRVSRSGCSGGCVSREALFARLLSLANRNIVRGLLRACEALMFLPAFGTFPSVVSAFVMSHKPDLRPLLEREQSKRLG